MVDERISEELKLYGITEIPTGYAIEQDGLKYIVTKDGQEVFKTVWFYNVTVFLRGVNKRC